MPEMTENCRWGRVGTHHPLPLQNDDLSENETALPRNSDLSQFLSIGIS
ncbi:hypothetical protein [Microcoleus anatoxicus]|uniref:Uncharacterized protein n=1 Tax=Microcoleus anatoxicus PTRS2 TaxID=2705321 RepID=A0ABU8YTQ4_9CYAN